MIDGLKKHPKANLGVQPTPLEFLPRLSKELDIKLWAKRDDYLPFTLGGNKVRQLEYYLGRAQDMDADSVLITGAIQSNFVRLCAAACRKLGLKPIVQLERRVPRDDAIYNSSGNVLLNGLLQAEIHYFDEGEDEAAADSNLDHIAEALRKQGKNPYVIHLGTDHAPIGALGYVEAAEEVYTQFQAQGNMPDHILIPSGSGLTHAGFLCGTRAIGWDVNIHGICVRRNSELQHPRILQRVKEVNKLIGVSDSMASGDIKTSDAVLEPGYGQLNEQVSHAINLAANAEGVLLEPVYSGRTFAGLMELVKSGHIAKHDTVAFIHTGGLAALFAYQNDLDLTRS